MSPTRWNLSGLRPLNHPRRRLMAAAQLAPLRLHLLQQPHALTASHETYWTHHLTWKKTCVPTALIGTTRANAIHINLIAPLRAALGQSPQLETLKPEPLNRLI